MTDYRCMTEKQLEIVRQIEHDLYKALNEQLIGTGSVEETVAREVNRLNALPFQERVNVAAAMMFGHFGSDAPTDGLADVTFSLDEQDPLRIHVNLQMSEPLKRVEVTLKIEDQG